MKIHTYMSGEPEVLKEGTLVRHICCNCGLVHQRHIEKARGGVVAITYYRDDWDTIKARKRMKKKEKCK